MGSDDVDEKSRFFGRSVGGWSLRECPFYVVTRASLVMTSALKKSFSGAGLGKVRPAALVVLWCLWEQEGLKMSELAKRAGIEPSTMTGLLDRMERDGYVFRKANPEDRRTLEIYLTETGKKIREPTERIVEKTLQMLYDGVDEQELDLTNDVLYRMMDNAKGGGNS